MTLSNYLKNYFFVVICIMIGMNFFAYLFNKMFSSKKDEKSIYTRETLKKELKEGTILFKWCLIVLTVFFLIMYLVQNNITEIKEHWKDPLLLVLPFYTILIIIRITELIDYYIKLWKIIKLEKKENYWWISSCDGRNRRVNNLKKGEKWIKQMPGLKERYLNLRQN